MWPVITDGDLYGSYCGFKAVFKCMTRDTARN